MSPNHNKLKTRFTPGTGKFNLADRNKPIILISDLHLTPESPETLEYFHHFIDSLRNIHSLYILGDLFEYWLGDDSAEKLGHSPVENTLRNLTNDGTPLFVIPGNRDFLLDKDFADRTGAIILNNSTVRLFFGHPTLLLHGDCLCTDDVSHQNFRSIVDDPEWRSTFLAKSIGERDEIGQAIRFRSNTEKRYKASHIMDVNQNTIESMLKPTGTRLLIHGHTPRPDIHQWVFDGHIFSRIVLGDWETGPSWIEIWESNLQLYYKNSVKQLNLDQMEVLTSVRSNV